MKKPYAVAIVLLLAFAAAVAEVRAPRPVHTALPEETSAWFPFDSAPGQGQCYIDVSGWLDGPAGKHGFLRDNGDDFTFEDGTPIKFWGTNICEDLVAPSAPTAERWADKLARYGVNGVRFHKFTYAGKKGIGATEGGSTDLDPAKLDRMDFFSNTLRDRGIYVGWSPIYGHILKPADRDRVLAYDEIEKAGGSTLGLVDFAPGLQDLHVELLVRLLEHRNPYTGLRYADDPGLAFVEIQNEDDIFFGFAKSASDRCPTYRKLFCQQFSRWLKQRYASHEALATAWGRRAFDEGENLDAETVYPIAHAWWYGEEGLRKKSHQRARLLDTAQFLHETQNAYYTRAAEAIRATGYRGVIIGSNWQAGSGISHFYNLRSDALVGAVDRHIYTGGGTGHRLVPGRVDNTSNLSTPGGGLLAAGRQAVSARPFMISEWLSLIPNEWIAEGPPLMAAYGLGLQGWDGAFSFASNTPGWTDTLQTPFIYNVDSPTQLAQYPALALMLYRGDVREGDLISERSVGSEALWTGVLPFNEEIIQEGDRKRFIGSLPQEALAVGKSRLAFTEKPTPEYLGDLSSFSADNLISSTTGQLRWDTAGEGFISIDTPGTQGVVGFAASQVLSLTDIEIRPATPFCSLLVSSLDREPLARTHRALVTAIARAQNTGMQYGPGRRTLTDPGKAPILLEPVTATISTKTRRIAEVRVLNHAGYDTGRKVGLNAASFIIGAEHKTIYYLITYAD